MKSLALFIPVLALSSAWAQPPLDPASLYVNDPLKWERPQRPGRPAQKSAFGRVLLVDPDGRVATISCYLYKTADNRLHIIYSEGFAMSSGTWKKADGHLAVRLKSIHSSGLKLGAQNDRYIEEKWGYAPAPKGERVAEWIKIDSARFVPLRNLAGPEELAKVVQFYRTEAENPK